MKKVILLSVIAAAIFGCTDDDVQTYDNSPYLIGFSEDALTKNYVTSGEVYDLNIPVELLGGMTGSPIDTDVTVTYEVDPSSTATEGYEFGFAETGHTATLAAGATAVNIPVKIYSENMESGPGVVSKFFILNVTQLSTNSDNVLIAQNFKQIKVTLNGLCYSALAGMYTVNVVREDTGAAYTLPGDQVFQESAGVYLTSSTGPYNNRGLYGASAQLASDTPGFVFNDICGDLKLDTQNLANAYTNIVTQDAAQAAMSHYVGETGSFVVAYSVWFTNNTVERRYVGTYTPE